MAPVDSGGPVRPAAADTITTYTLPASPPQGPDAHSRISGIPHVAHHKDGRQTSLL